MSWREFWNADTTIFANARHQEIHCRAIAGDILRLLPRSGMRVLDFGCGDALCADEIADCCGKLVLCDAAATVRKRLIARFGSLANVVVTSPELAEQTSDVAFDLIIVNSVVQYFDRTEFDKWLGIWRRMLLPNGQLILGDVVPPNVGQLRDAHELLRFARRNGFLTAAMTGVVRTYFSSYRTTRAQAGFLRFDEQELIELVRRSGFAAMRLGKNLGHNSARLAFIASPLQGLTAA